MQQILVIQTASIGDVILATALAETLHATFPEAAVDFLVKKGNEPLFAGHPFIREMIVWDKRTNKYINLLNIIGRIRKKKYDLVVNAQRFFSSGLITVLSGAEETRGFSKNPLSLFFSKNTAHDITSGIHEISRNHKLISDLAGDRPSTPGLYPQEADKNLVQPLISGICFSISPASLWFTKQYPVGKWIELIHRISPEATVFLLGAPSDFEMCEEIIREAQHPGLRNMAGKLTFLQSAALMKRCRMNFTNDSAPMHLASAVDAPVTAIYCSTIPGFGFGPLSSDSKIVEIDFPLSCRPCGLHGLRNCPEQHFSCAMDIDVELLVKRLRQN